MRYIAISLFIVSTYHICTAQTTLIADGPGETYELINSVLAPEYNVIEAPDCGHDSFGRHIDEVYDDVLDKHVFRFHIHTVEDNDRCINFDRQRNEIKSYDKSPDHLKAALFEEVEYKWKFKLDSAFQASGRFTHLHQIKAVGGPEDAMPLITLTARKGSPDKLELRYAESFSQTTLYQTDLAPLKGVWVEAKEMISYDEVGLGKYAIIISSVADGDTLFNYSNGALRTWKTNADFLRPKWGIYRSIINAEDLRDEQVLFADFSIEELSNTTSLTNYIIEEAAIQIYPNPTTNEIVFSEEIMDTFDAIDIYNLEGRFVLSKAQLSNPMIISNLNSGLYFVRFKTDKIQSQPIKILINHD